MKWKIQFYMRWMRGKTVQTNALLMSSQPIKLNGHICIAYDVMIVQVIRLPFIFTWDSLENGTHNN